MGYTGLGPPKPKTIIHDAPVHCYFGSSPTKIERKGGRKAGTPNVWGTDAKRQLDEVFRQCGGVDGMVVWAKANPDTFYPLYIRAKVPKPVEAPTDDGAGITIIVSARNVPEAPALKQIEKADEQAADHKQG